MKRLAIIRQKYNPAGGAERIVSAIVKQLQAGGEFSPLLISRNWESLPGVDTVGVKPFYLGSVWRDWSFARAARAAWRQAGTDLVQSHERIPGCHVYRADDGVHAAWLATRIAMNGWRARLSILLNPYHYYMCWVERRMYHHADFRTVICISEMVKRDVVQYMGVDSKRCAVIYNGIDVQYFNPVDARASRSEMRSKLGINADTPVLVYVGSGFARKGVSQAIYSIVPHPSVHLIIVGADKHISRYRRLAKKLGVAGRVIFVGAQKNVLAYYGMSDGFILPSVYEPLGLLLLRQWLAACLF
nr:glycosyltransferase family 4 protein [Chromobacterium haemolyticum]